MNFIKRDDTIPVKQMIEIFINNELNSMGKESAATGFDLSHLSKSLRPDGSVYKIMDEVCGDLVKNGWYCYYQHYFTFTSRISIWISPNPIKNRPVSQFKHFVPCVNEWADKDNKFFPEKA